MGQGHGTQHQLWNTVERAAHHVKQMPACGLLMAYTRATPGGALLQAAAGVEGHGTVHQHSAVVGCFEQLGLSAGVEQLGEDTHGAVVLLEHSSSCPTHLVVADVDACDAALQLPGHCHGGAAIPAPNVQRLQRAQHSTMQHSTAHVMRHQVEQHRKA